MPLRPDELAQALSAGRPGSTAHHSWVRVDMHDYRLESGPLRLRRIGRGSTASTTCWTPAGRAPSCCCPRPGPAARRSPATAAVPRPAVRRRPGRGDRGTGATGHHRRLSLRPAAGRLRRERIHRPLAGPRGGPLVRAARAARGSAAGAAGRRGAGGSGAQPVQAPGELYQEAGRHREGWVSPVAETRCTEPAPTRADGGGPRPADSEHTHDSLFRNAYSLMLNTGVSAVLGLGFWLVAARYYSEEAVGQGSAAIAAMRLLASITAMTMIGRRRALRPARGAGHRPAGLAARTRAVRWSWRWPRVVFLLTLDALGAVVRAPGTPISGGGVRRGVRRLGAAHPPGRGADRAAQGGVGAGRQRRVLGRQAGCCWSCSPARCPSSASSCPGPRRSPSPCCRWAGWSSAG